MTQVSVLIPAHDEAGYLEDCLAALLSSEPVSDGAEVVVIANGCKDATAEIARSMGRAAKEAGWTLNVLELKEGGKLGALNAGEAAAVGKVLIYLDADVLVSRHLVSQISQVLDTSKPTYASGVPNVTTRNSLLTRLYTRFWLTTPFMSRGVPGFGVFAMNRSGRARWGDWPDIISDDTFARLNFTPKERLVVPAQYDWPMIEGFSRLVRVRRRQDVGVAEIETRFPHLLKNDDDHAGVPGVVARGLGDPLAFLAFLAVRAAIHLPVLRSAERWVRGR